MLTKKPARRLAVPLLDLQAQYRAIEPEVMDALRDVCARQQFILGPRVTELEERIAEYSGCRYGVGLSSGTDALLAAMMALEIGPGDEVVTSTYSFFATGGCIARLGARPVFIDIDPATFNLDCRQLDGACSAATKAIIPVHLFGLVADMDEMLAVSRRRGIPIIEDAAQAIGARRNGRTAGSFGSIGCFSFFPSKNLGAFGDAGLVTTNDSGLAARARQLRDHGMEPRYYHHVV